MKKTNFKTLKDEDGKVYVFNSEKFSDALVNHCAILRKAGLRASKAGVYEAILDEMELNDVIEVTTTDAIKKWESGVNGPGSMKLVKICAQILNVNYLELLDESEKKSEVERMNKSEVLLINEIFGKLVDIVASSTEKKIADISELMKPLHNIIEDRFLDTSVSVRNRLHRITSEIVEEYEGKGIRHPKRWYHEITSILDGEMQTFTTCEGFSWSMLYACFKNRDEILKYACSFEGIHLVLSYLCDELCMASAFGFEDYKELDDELEDLIYNVTERYHNGFEPYYPEEIDEEEKDYVEGSYLSEEEQELLTSYGSDEIKGFTPFEVFRFTVSREIRKIFEKDFPEMKY